MAEEIDIAGKSEAPKRFKGDGNEAEQHSLPDQIAADRYLASKAATRRKRGLGIILRKIVAPGATDGRPNY